jgi:hypothetical protein
MGFSYNGRYHALSGLRKGATSSAWQDCEPARHNFAKIAKTELESFSTFENDRRTLIPVFSTVASQSVIVRLVSTNKAAVF